MPIIGKVGSKSGIGIFNKIVAFLTNHPKVNNNITDGIRVLEDVTSNTYAKSKSAQTVIIIDAFIYYFFFKFISFLNSMFRKRILFNRKITFHFAKKVLSSQSLILRGFDYLCTPF